MSARYPPGSWFFEALQRGDVDMMRLRERQPREVQEVLQQPESVSPEAVTALLNQSELISGNAHIGLHMIRLADVSWLGPLGYLLTNARTVREMLDLACRYYRIFYHHVTMSLSTKRERVVVEFRWAHPVSVPTRHQDEWTLGFFVDQIRSRIGPKWNPSRVSFNNEPPKYLEELQDLFGPHLEFSQPVNSFEFASNDLDCHTLNADPHLLPILLDHADHLLQELVCTRSLESEIRLAIIENLQRGNGSEEAVSRLLYLSSSTLKRRLREKNLSFRRLRDEVIKELSQKALLKTNCSITEIALRMGYSELSAFSRAFSRLTGLSPVAFRRSMRSP